MKGYSLGYHNQDLVFSADIFIGEPELGFSFEIGKTGDPFYPVASFSGHSGYIFDQSGFFIGGYRKNQTINISGNYFFGDVTQSGRVSTDDNATGRLSYYINDILIANNINGPTGFFDTILFNDQSGNNTLSLTLTPQTGSPTILLDKNSVRITSSEGYYFSTND